MAVRVEYVKGNLLGPQELVVVASAEDVVDSGGRPKIGSVVEETGEIYAGTLPITEERPQEMGIFVVLPPWDDKTLLKSFNTLYGKDHPSGDTVVSDFGSLYRLANTYNAAVKAEARDARKNGNNGNNGKHLSLVEIPSMEAVKVIIENRHKGELAVVFNKYGLTSCGSANLTSGGSANLTSGGSINFTSGGSTEKCIWTDDPGKFEEDPTNGKKNALPYSLSRQRIDSSSGKVSTVLKKELSSGFLVSLRQV